MTSLILNMVFTITVLIILNACSASKSPTVADNTPPLMAGDGTVYDTRCMKGVKSYAKAVACVVDEPIAIPSTSPTASPQPELSTLPGIAPVDMSAFEQDDLCAFFQIPMKLCLAYFGYPQWHKDERRSSCNTNMLFWANGGESRLPRHCYINQPYQKAPFRIPEGLFRVGQTIYYSNGYDAFCGYSSPQHFYSITGMNYIPSNIPSYPAIPFGMRHDQFCGGASSQISQAANPWNPSTVAAGLFKVGGTVYYSNGQDAFCGIESQQRLFELTGSYDTPPGTPVYGAVPTGMRHDWLCR